MYYTVITAKVNKKRPTQPEFCEISSEVRPYSTRGVYLSIKRCRDKTKEEKPGGARRRVL